MGGELGETEANKMIGNIYARLRARFGLIFNPRPTHKAEGKLGEKTMSIYTDSMVAELMARDTWSYADAVAYAEKHPTVSARSVISKIKSLKLDYVAKEKPAAAGKVEKVRKSDIVSEIASALSINADAISGLAKADAKALRELLAAVAK